MTIRLIAPLLCGLIMFAATASSFAEDPISGIGISVELSGTGSIVAQLKTDSKGSVTIEAPGPGTYIFRYTDGPNKGQVLTAVRAAKAGPVTVSVPTSSAVK